MGSREKAKDTEQLKRDRTIAILSDLWELPAVGSQLLKKVGDLVSHK